LRGLSVNAFRMYCGMTEENLKNATTVINRN
jgi:hypothetical protein